MCHDNSTNTDRPLSEPHAVENQNDRTDELEAAPAGFSQANNHY
jgi:hypothetical protein